jgi:hypothetical protein
MMLHIFTAGVRQANCDFASMDAPRSLKKDLNREDLLPKSGDMSADMDAALRKLENRRAAAALHRPSPPTAAIPRESSLPQQVSARRRNLLRLCLLFRFVSNIAKQICRMKY